MRDIQDLKLEWLSVGQGKQLTDTFTRDSATLRRTAEGRIGEAQAGLQRKLPGLEHQEHVGTALVVSAQAALDAAIAESRRARQATQGAREDAIREERRIRKQLQADLDQLDAAHRRRLESEWKQYKIARHRGAAA